MCIEEIGDGLITDRDAKVVGNRDQDEVLSRVTRHSDWSEVRSLSAVL